jgi:hypothetical protein
MEDPCTLTRKPIKTPEIMDQLKAPTNGTVIIFENIVHNN